MYNNVAIYLPFFWLILWVTLSSSTITKRLLRSRMWCIATRPHQVRRERWLKVLLVSSGSSLPTRAGFNLMLRQSQSLCHAKISNQSDVESYFSPYVMFCYVILRVTPCRQRIGITTDQGCANSMRCRSGSRMYAVRCPQGRVAGEVTGEAPCATNSAKA